MRLTYETFMIFPILENKSKQNIYQKVVFYLLSLKCHIWIEKNK